MLNVLSHLSCDLKHPTGHIPKDKASNDREGGKLRRVKGGNKKKK